MTHAAALVGHAGPWLALGGLLVVLAMAALVWGLLVLEAAAYAQAPAAAYAQAPAPHTKCTQTTLADGSALVVCRPGTKRVIDAGS